ncbi:MAG: hypothetical protein ACOY32_15295, partial [Thermodesulfobacteriota bacterium]
MRKEIIVRERPVKELSEVERREFARLQKVVFEDMRAFYRVGMALLEIRDRELYREESATFEGYCKKVFDFSRGHAYRLMGAAKVVENISPDSSPEMSPNWRHDDGKVIDLIPMSESQVRPLVRLQPDQQREVWQAVVKNAGPRRKVTASLVNGVVKKYLGETAQATVRVAREKVQSAPAISADFKAAFDAFFTQLGKEIEAGYKSTARGVILAHIDQIRSLVSDVEESAWDGNSQDAIKLEKAGYQLFRMDKSSMTIKIRAGGGWPKYSGPYDTIKEMEEAFAELMLDQKNLRA